MQYFYKSVHPYMIHLIDRAQKRLILPIYLSGNRIVIQSAGHQEVFDQEVFDQAFNTNWTRGSSETVDSVHDAFPELVELVQVADSVTSLELSTGPLHPTVHNP